MKLRVRKKAVVWVALLPIGVLVLLFAKPLYRHPYDDRGFGRFYGFAGGTFVSREGFLFIKFEGRTKPEWRWAPPSNYRYGDVDFEWDAGSTKGSGQLNLPSMTLTTSDGVTSIDRDWFLSRNDHENTATTYMDLLTAARDGTLPPPRHHWHRFHDTVDGRLAHFSLGISFPYTVLAWGFIWLAASIIILIRRANRPAQNKGRQATASPSPAT